MTLQAVLTPTEHETARTRRAFRQKIDVAAAALAASKRPLKVAIASEPETETVVPVVRVDPEVVVLDDLLMPHAPAKRATVKDVQIVVCRHYRVSRDEILSPRRTANLVLPRHVGMYLARKLTMNSFPEIGRRFGGKDHSTVLHAIRQIDARLRRGPSFQTTLDNLSAQIIGATKR